MVPDLYYINNKFYINTLLGFNYWIKEKSQFTCSDSFEKITGYKLEKLIKCWFMCSGEKIYKINGLEFDNPIIHEINL